MRIYASNFFLFFATKLLLGAICVLGFCFIGIPSVSAQVKQASTRSPSYQAPKPEADKNGKPDTKAPVSKAGSPKIVQSQPAKSITPKAPQSYSKPNRVTVTKGKSKPQQTSMTSTRTKAKAEAITAGLEADLPSNIKEGISKFFGLKYQLGGEGQNGIDCSALVQQVYSDVFGVKIPRTSTEQSQLGDLEYVPKSDLRTGDLVFFGPNRKKVNHVGMYLAGGYFLQAARSEGVTISRLDNSYWNSRFMFSKRMHGIDTSEDEYDSKDFERDLTRDAYAMILDREKETQVCFLDFGIKFNTSFELLLSGFLINSINDHGPSGDFSSPFLSEKGPQSSSSSEGVRLSAVFTPIEWIKLIPSFSSLEMREEHSRDIQKIGLETWMSFPRTRMTVLMTAYSNSYDPLFERPFSLSTELQPMDFAIGLHYKISDSLIFALFGSHIYKPDTRSSDYKGNGSNSAIDEISLELNIKF